MIDVNVLSLGFTNALRTGNVSLDMVMSSIICIMIPLIVTSISKYGDNIVNIISNYLKRKPNKHNVTKIITSHKTRSKHGWYVHENENYVLQKALLLYMKTIWDGYNIPISNVSLVQTKSKYDDEGFSCPKAKHLDTLLIASSPIDNRTMDITSNIKMSISNMVENESGNSNIQMTTKTCTLEIYGKNHKDVDDFISNAFQHYKDIVKTKITDKRYIIYPSIKSHSKYELTNEKTFDSLFIPNKNNIVKLIDSFVNKQDKFAIRGFPQKLGFMLYGPPGTGKTSLIKAIAHYTQRHIVSVPLKQIKSNKKLMELMFGLKLEHENENEDEDDIHLCYNNTIFVMEDIDAACDIVHSRDAKTKNKDNDALDLAGILNVLDGAVDCPGRIVIMTTNHIEKLDPALIRPGRINMKIHLDYIKQREASEMIKYYFNRYIPIVNWNIKLTPAELEEYCIECNSADELLNKLNH